MPGITLKNGLISYYGNPAGYTEKEKAVVDSIFQNDELTAWLKSRSLTPQWTDGVMERLAAGERMGGMNESAAPLKNVRVWQLKPETDVYRKFISYEETVRQFGEPSREHYRVAYDGQLDTNDLEAIYTRCNVNHPPGYDGHSLSMSDVVELYDAEGSEFHYGINQTVTGSVSSSQSSAVTQPQNAVSYFPEFGYEAYWRLLDRMGSGRFEFQKNPYSTYKNRTHFSPIWMLDGAYTVNTWLIDAWTPDGMLSANLTDSLTIRGNLWQDWHAGPIQP